MEESLIGLLLASAGLTALVSTRVNWNRIEAPALPPYIILRRVSGVRDYRMSGATGLVETRVQVDCFGATYASAKGAARAIEAAISGYKGASSTTTFDGIFLAAERDLIDDDDTPADLHGVSLDFMVWHKET
jgi:hypothetical protein